MSARLTLPKPAEPLAEEEASAGAHIDPQIQRWAPTGRAAVKALAAAIRTLGPVDLVLAGRSSVDGGASAVCVMVAALLGLPLARLL
ncbi:hypothetical protein [Sphaerisporangium sp. NPDC051011]|uniref:hypothetical protein n=1 Tax=Sphaerisporangium sp. NPDC051011 TaxID=3155792 RepID=UPI0033F6B6A6